MATRQDGHGAAPGRPHPGHVVERNIGETLRGGCDIDATTATTGGRTLVVATVTA